MNAGKAWRKLTGRANDLYDAIPSSAMVGKSTRKSLDASDSWSVRAANMVGLKKLSPKRVLNVGKQMYDKTIKELEKLKQIIKADMDELDAINKLTRTDSNFIKRLNKLDPEGLEKLDNVNDIEDLKRFNKLDKNGLQELSDADKKRFADLKVKQKNVDDRNLLNADALIKAKNAELKGMDSKVQTKIDGNVKERDVFSTDGKIRDDVDKDLAEKVETKVKGIEGTKKLNKLRGMNKKQKAAVFVGATSAAAGIHAGITGQSFKESNKDVMGALREGVDPVADAAGVVGAGAVAVAAETATTIVKVGVDSSEPLLDELGKGVSNIGEAFGLGLPDFGFGDMGGTLFIVGILIAYYFYQKSTSTTSQSVDTMIYN